MKSLAPNEYESLPALESPAGYICVIRDIDRDLYRIEATRLPKELVDAVLAGDERSFGIELVSVLQTDDLAASEAKLYARHHARPSSEWLELDSHQLDVLRQSVLQIDAHASRYLPSGNSALSEAAASDRLDDPASYTPFREYSQTYMPDRGQWKRRRPRTPIPNIRYGAGALRRSRQAAEARRAEEERQRRERYYRLSTEDRIKEYIGDFLVNHIVAITIIVIALFVLPLAHIVLTRIR